MKKVQLISFFCAIIFSFTFFAGCGTSVTDFQAQTAIHATAYELAGTQDSNPLNFSARTLNNDPDNDYYTTITNDYTDSFGLGNMLEIISKLIEESKLTQSQKFTQYSLTLSMNEENIPVRFRVYCSNAQVYADAMIADNFIDYTYYQIISAKINYDFANDKLINFTVNFVWKHTFEEEIRFASIKYFNETKYAYDNTKDTDSLYKNACIESATALLGKNVTVSNFDITEIYDDVMNNGINDVINNGITNQDTGMSIVVTCDVPVNAKVYLSTDSTGAGTLRQPSSDNIVTVNNFNKANSAIIFNMHDNDNDGTQSKTNFEDLGKNSSSLICDANGEMQFYVFVENFSAEDSVYYRANITFENEEEISLFKPLYAVSEAISDPTEEELFLY